jgi:hypothetical protein
MNAPQSIVQRFTENYIPVTESGCWLWVGALTSQGYGQMRGMNHRVTRAHRVAYELFKGPIPEGLYIDHLCRVRCCVNPDHLEAVTQFVNMARKSDHYFGQTKEYRANQAKRDAFDRIIEERYLLLKQIRSAVMNPGQNTPQDAQNSPRIDEEAGR